MIETIELGIGFDEPVTISGTESTGLSATASVMLEPEDDDRSFAGQVRAVDEVGNATDLRLEVCVGSPQSIRRRERKIVSAICA